MSTLTDANGIAQNAYTLALTAGPEDVMAMVAFGTTTPVVAAFVETGH